MAKKKRATRNEAHIQDMEITQAICADILNGLNDAHCLADLNPRYERVVKYILRRVVECEDDKALRSFLGLDPTGKGPGRSGAATIWAARSSSASDGEIANALNVTKTTADGVRTRGRNTILHWRQQYAAHQEKKSGD